LVSSFFAHPALVATNFGQNSLTEVQLSSKENIAERGKPWCRVERTRVIENFMRFSLKAKNSHPIGILVFSLASCCLFVGGALALDEAKIHVAGTPNITSFVYHVGKEKGFYREEGIELQPIMAGMLQGIQGLIGGSFDYSQMLGQGGSAIMRGAPLKIVMAFDTRPSWFLLGTKNMKSIQDLKGKQLAVSSFGAALDQMTRELLPRFGLEPMRDVILRAIEPPPNRLAALLSGAVDAAVLTHPETIIARRQGFNELIFFGDHIEFVSAGVVATEKNISQRPDFVRRFIRGALKTIYWIKSNEKEVVARLAKATKSSEADGLELYWTGLKLFSQDGTIPRTLQERMISLQRKVLQVEKEVPPESIYDFSFVRTGNKELGKGESP
jgi:NitT/TauT family transport system substrate-binding protein